jgi:cation transport ATPase
MADDVEPAASISGEPSAERMRSRRTVAVPSGEIVLRVEGMTCGWCGQRAAAALADVPGVKSVRVDLLTETAMVEPAEAGADLLIDAVRRAGYDAVARRGQRGEAADVARLHEQRRREHRQALVTAVGMGLPIVGLQWAAPALSGTHDGAHFWPTTLQALLALLLFVSPAGGPLLAGGFRALLHRLPSQDLLIAMALVMAAAAGLASMVLADRQVLNHFPTAALILIVVHIGRYLELSARLKLAGLDSRFPVSDFRSESHSRMGIGPLESAPEDGFSPTWLAETAAALLVPATIVVAGVAGAIWWLLGDMSAGLAVTMAVLLSASPRGVGMAVPASAAAVGGTNARGVDTTEPALRRAVWQNLVIAGIISDGGVILAVLGLLGPRAAPVFMMGASLAVLVNALRLRRQSPQNA